MCKTVHTKTRKRQNHLIHIGFWKKKKSDAGIKLQVRTCFMSFEGTENCHHHRQMSGCVANSSGFWLLCACVQNLDRHNLKSFDTSILPDDQQRRQRKFIYVLVLDASPIIYQNRLKVVKFVRLCTETQ